MRLRLVILAGLLGLASAGAAAAEPSGPAAIAARAPVAYADGTGYRVRRVHRHRSYRHVHVVPHVRRPWWALEPRWLPCHDPDAWNCPVAARSSGAVPVAAYDLSRLPERRTVPAPGYRRSAVRYQHVKPAHRYRRHVVRHRGIRRSRIHRRSAPFIFRTAD
ncbi:hypothetical protein [uncultured Enterovirga sp.]|uniref:hypothetical protein n=1 Tax=uncultured Enterovirga sp. TaxID=2026352 RepID=UPI0035CA4CDC